MTKKKKVTIILSIIILVIIGVILGLRIRDSNLRRAEYTGNKLSFDGKVYEETSYTEIQRNMESGL